MKVVVLMDEHDDYAYPIGAFIVPDDYNPVISHKEWAKESYVPIRWSNQYGRGESSKCSRPTISFTEWLRKKYEEVEIVTWDWY